MDLLTQLKNAVKYIEENICDDIELAGVSSATNYSPYHFGRIFYYISDMPLSEYIRRRKLSLAAMELQNSSIKIIDLAVKYGYDNADSFTRAFVKHHGVTPTEARRSGVILKIFPPITFQIKIQGVQEMNWRIEEKEAFEVFGIEKIFKSDEMGNIPNFWSDCYHAGKYHKLLEDGGGNGEEHFPDTGISVVNALAAYYDFGEGTYPYMICAFKKDNCKTDGYKILNVPKSTWAVFRSDEAYDPAAGIGTLYKQAYSEWLPSSSGYDRTCGPDMEIYYMAKNKKYYNELWIPVTKKNG
jgi:AraC family transcriptional regulator